MRLGRVACLVAIAAALAAALPAVAGGDTVFLHSAKRGELRGGRLVLHGVRGRVTWMTDGGRTGVVSVRRLHRRLFLPRTPAIATLHIAGHRGGDEPTFRLSRPRFNASRHTVSYRVKRLDRRRSAGRLARGAQSSVPRRFGAASLSILGAPRLTSGDNGGHDCGVGLVNETGFGVKATSASKWDTDTWGTGVTINSVVPSHSKVPTGQDTEVYWESDGGFLRGCANSAVWTVVIDPNDPGQSPPPASVTFTLGETYTWSGSPQTACTSSNPQFSCVRSSGAYWLLRGPVPCCQRATPAARRLG